MGVVIRPRFGQLCFLCSNIVPEPRIRALRKAANAAGQRFLKSDILCVDCEAKERRRAEARAWRL